MNLSVIMITKNESKQIKRSLGSVEWAKEKIVVDSHSEDNTQQLAQHLGAKVYQSSFKDFASQKNKALSYASQDWVLSLDADEEVTPELKDTIQKLMNRSQNDAYRIPRKSVMFGRQMQYTGTQDDKPIRLFKRKCARFVQPIHETIDIQGSTSVVEEPLMHYTYDSISEYVNRLNRYTTMEAKWIGSKRSVGWVDMSLRPVAMFFKLYLWKWGFRDGWQGLAFSFLSAFYVFVKYAKVKECV